MVAVLAKVVQLWAHEFLGMHQGACLCAGQRQGEAGARANASFQPPPRHTDTICKFWSDTHTLLELFRSCTCFTTIAL